MSAVFFLCRSYLTPVRDEEAESLRKARSRQARQTRRSTQVSVTFAFECPFVQCFHWTYILSYFIFTHTKIYFFGTGV
jgi:hypothetical protein